MSGVNSQALARLYRDILNESLGLARMHAQYDKAAASAITAAFESIIPHAVPAQFADQIENPQLRQVLRSEAARQLVGICHGMPLPRGTFVAAVATAAHSKI